MSNQTHQTMMKKITSVLLLLVLLCLGNEAWATDYFKLNGKAVTGTTTLTSSSSGYGISSGTVSFNVSTKTITLTNAVVKTTSSGTSTLNMLTACNIKVVGECKLENSNYRVINSENSGLTYTISGDGMYKSTLKLISNTTDKTAFRLGSRNDVTIKDLNFYAEGSSGINGDGNSFSFVTIKDCLAELKSKGDESPIRNLESLTLSSTDKIYTKLIISSPEKASYDKYKEGVVDSNGNLLKKGTTVKISPAMYIPDSFPDAYFCSYLIIMPTGADKYLTPEEVAGTTTINVMNENISDLRGIEYFTALTYLNCNNNNLSSLDVSANTALKSLSCNNNNFSSLDVSKNKKLTYLDCRQNRAS